MSTIASPRPSINLSSRRGSGSTDTTTRSASTSHPAHGSVRRNRAALRDYYGLKSTAAASSSPDPSAAPTPAPTEPADDEEESELDDPSFDPDRYVHRLLATEGVEGILRAEAGLVAAVRSLDSEKKALVYDNYSKLIAATETIRRMRSGMDPLTPTTSTLTPAIGAIAETAAALAGSLRRQAGGQVGKGVAERERQRERVRWALAAPARLRGMVEDGREAEARSDWTRVAGLLEKWDRVEGVAGLREECRRAFGDD